MDSQLNIVLFKNCLKGRSSLTNNGNGEEQQRNGSSERGRPAAMRKRRFLVCMAFFMLRVVSAVGDTYFLEQADTMNSMIHHDTFILQLWHQFALFIFSTIYTEIVKRINRTDLKKYAGCAGLSVSMVLAIFCCFTAAKVEVERLNRVKSNRVVERYDEYSDEYKNVIDMTTFWMVPQYTLLGGLEGISSESIDILFSNYPLEPMDPYLNHLATGVHGLGNIGNILVVFILGKASAWRDGTSWFQDTLDKSRLDKYYWSLAAVSIVNLVFYTILYYWHDLRNHVSELRLSIVSSNTQGREAADHVP
ncbi:hypothetical protein TIFTF001_003758 [Ficus carica]|uniref:Uncharacterized protein n=1 Tax=Ficus carica TaxID=3494 RepID=A0AA87ZGB9_FICCA|nr:hypothetical protein TIFTF001_003758 [Ficus carica]